MYKQSTSTAPEGIFDRYHRTAQVRIRNNTSNDLVGVSVAHKYSDDYKDYGSWGLIRPGDVSSTITVNYTTGTFTTGRDWWLLQFATDKWFCHTDPKNFREVIDFLESQAPSLIGKIVGLATRMAMTRKGQQPPPDLDRLVENAEKAAESLVRLLTNGESTVGFKQHILKDADANRTTEIIVNSDWSITFHSTSGDSETKLAWKDMSQ